MNRRTLLGTAALGILSTALASRGHAQAGPAANIEKSLEAFRSLSPDTAVSISTQGADSVRKLIKDAGLHKTRIPDSTRKLFSYLAGAPSGTDIGWNGMLDMQNGKPPGQLRSPMNDHPREERRLDTNPLRTTWNHFTNNSDEIFAGVWASEVGSWRCEHGPREDEFFFVTEGRCRIIDGAGNAIEVGPGESLVIPANFKGIFEVLEPMKKHYVIIERTAD